ncbi:TetR/AcrR family transcriptional regulator [Sphingomonas lacunae]|uniref:TetR/AcrR family transcriptional regulator n=1 Tax=Sphingomonas lacunae TaxID=2698828 RepID=A0A6M4AU57_9SPHN|nr:TetR family transcriptional regulator [Sphingomonas lacunae]QJQ32613.1 TetR/AcrR family transcriptional regulator [Sphingomonas lacunae]
MSALPKNPRSQRTYRALVVAGLELLAERPIDALAVDEIVSRARVAKGSFFNHFHDKAAFGRAIGGEIRTELEERIGRANATVSDPVARLAGGMRTGLIFALEEPRKTKIMLLNMSQSTLRDQPLNQGVAADMSAAFATGRLRKEARESGIRYWLGLCQVLMINAIERRVDATEAAKRLEDMIILALTGLGLSGDDAASYAASQSQLLLEEHQP